MIRSESLFDTFNAKHKSAIEVAATFVSPPNILSQLMSHNHVILSGPRGSGKTTLLKMLTIPALSDWDANDADIVRSNVDFVAIFIPADRSWHGQLKLLAKTSSDPRAAGILGLATFTTHIFKAMVSSFLDWQWVREKCASSLLHLIPQISYEEEQRIVGELAKFWLLSPLANTFFELKRSLAARLGEIGILKNKYDYAPENVDLANYDFLFIDYREGIKRAHSLHNHASKLPNRRWLIMFDELEVAPTLIQEELIKDLRGTFEDGSILYRLAIAPYNTNFADRSDSGSPDVRNDYHHIDLTFPRKERGFDFSAQICGSMLRQSNIGRDIDFVLGPSYLSFDDEVEGEPDTDSGSKYGRHKGLGRVYWELAERDASFRSYLYKRRIDLAEIDALDEHRMASTLRKIRNIVIVRHYFSKASRSGLSAESLGSRSRKSLRLYAGIPSILALTEGNPRALINLLTPLLQTFRDGGMKHKISESTQAEEIGKAIRVMCSLLRSIPASRTRRESGAVLNVLDQIGAAMYAGVLSTKFSEQPPLSFRVDHGTSNDTLNAIGKALNMGALVHIPDHGSEEIISDLVGKRFRLNYMLAAHYKLPLSLGIEARLSKLLDRRTMETQTSLELYDED